MNAVATPKARKTSAAMIRVLNAQGLELADIPRRDARFLLESQQATLVSIEPMVIQMKASLPSLARVQLDREESEPHPMADDEFDMPITSEVIASVSKLTKDLKDAAGTMGREEARFLVSTYYQLQSNRIRADGQVRSLGDAKPHATLEFFGDQQTLLEGQIKRALDAYSLSTSAGRWMRSICGIGPVIAAGLMAHIDISQCPTAGHIWSFAGLNPNSKWTKTDDVKAWLKTALKDRELDDDFVFYAAGQFGRNGISILRQATHDHKTGEPKPLTVTSLTNALARRPWNADLKVLCYKAGESFVKVKGREQDYYGKYYTQRKVYEAEKNVRGEYADVAQWYLENFNFTRDTNARKAYLEGKLPDGHLHARARRYTVKLFLSHLHEVMYKEHFGKAPPAPYPIAFLGHAHLISPPNMPEDL